MQQTNESGFRLWLCNARGDQARPIGDAVSRCRWVEHYYGDLDELYGKDRLVEGDREGVEVARASPTPPTPWGMGFRPTKLARETVGVPARARAGSPRSQVPGNTPGSARHPGEDHA